MSSNSSPAMRTTMATHILESTSKPRLQALYSDFSRQRQSNPASFHANVEWWRKVLISLLDPGAQQGRCTDMKNRLTIRVDHGLLECLKLEKIGKPLAMGAVIVSNSLLSGHQHPQMSLRPSKNELCSTKSLIPLPEFISRRTSIYEPGWLPYRIVSFVVGRPLWWALEQTGVVGDQGYLRSSTGATDWYGDYVFVDLIAQAADAALSLQRTTTTGPADALYTRESFRKGFSAIFGTKQDSLSEMDTTIILKFLERERRALVVDNEIVKFVHDNSSHEEALITPVDRGIVELKTAISNLQHLIGVLQQRMNEYTRKAATALQQKQKQVALSYLRSRKQLEDILGQRLASLATLEGTMNSIEMAAGDVQIMKSYETSASTLQAILTHPSLQRTNIDKTMDALAEANHAAQEISNTVRVGGDVAFGVEFDEDELEDEWKALVQDIQADGYSKQLLEELSTPTTAPGAIGASARSDTNHSAIALPE